MWRLGEKPVLTASEIADGQGRASFTVGSELGDTGLAYGCDSLTAGLVFQRLHRDEWIQPVYKGNQFLGWTTAWAGEAELEKLRQRSVNFKQAFFVRPWDEDRDEFFSEVREAVRGRINIAIEAVWDRAHNDQIDERVLRLIRESAAVIVEVDRTRFNVGLEVGHALALGKQIVAIAQRPANGLFIAPTDLATLHCHLYDPADPKGLAEALSEKLLVAINSAKLMASCSL